MELKELFKSYKEDQRVELYGWIRNNRSGKQISFLNFNDGTFFTSVQVVYKKDEIDNFEEISKLNVASCIKVVGVVKLSDSQDAPFEIVAQEIELLAESDADYPLQKKKHSYEYLRTIAHLRARSNTFGAVFKVRSNIAFAIHKFFNELGYVYVHTPIISSTDCEGAGEIFSVTTLDILNPNNKSYRDDFFGLNAGLTVSGQLHGEAYAMAFQKIYTFGPTFRAENSHTTRHAAEFWMVEPEVAFCDLAQLMTITEKMLKYILQYVLETSKEELAFLNTLVEEDLVEKIEKIVSSEFVKITYTEAVEKLVAVQDEGHKFETKVEWGIDLATEHEKYLTDVIYKGPIFVVDYPKEIKAFYMYLNDDGKTVAAMDVLVPGIGELLGGSQRETRYDVLEKKILEANIDIESLQWYLDLRKYGCPTHSGFGLGFERLVMYVTGIENIRDVIPFPRTPNNCDF